jgi:hypothetical protein
MVSGKTGGDVIKRTVMANGVWLSPHNDHCRNPRSFTRMNGDHIDIVRRFRYDIYECFQRSQDAPFNVVDALMTETQANSFPEVSQSRWFERKWPSLYEAFEDGRIDEKRLRETFTDLSLQRNFSGCSGRAI